ncbi:hypothetical protein ACQPYK_38490 [Streptosporangium sp. CA-135522]|uniref:hypothetical protein n=1 Tax=Streptosporangium sp. CA-135522 TaxID=3240072 RepID=UPI003D90B4D1
MAAKVTGVRQRLRAAQRRTRHPIWRIERLEKSISYPSSATTAGTRPRPLSTSRTSLPDLDLRVPSAVDQPTGQARVLTEVTSRTGGFAPIAAMAWPACPGVFHGAFS